MAVRNRPKRSAPVAGAQVAGAPVAALAGIPVGPALATALASLTLKALTGFEIVLVLQARNRQSNHERGMLLATAAEMTRRTDPGFGTIDDDPDGDGDELRDRLQAGGRDGWDEIGSNEIRAALILTRRSANAMAALAQDLVGRLPTVLQAMIDGVLDQPRARIFSDYTSLLSPEHARAVVDALLPVAATLTTAQLIEAIAKAAIEIDPDWARRRYERALQGRRVEGVIGPDGTATLAGYQLPADQVAAACDRLDAIARHLKRAGHPDPINHIRADIFLGKLTGAYAAMTDEQLLAHLLAQMPTQPEHTPNTAPDPSTQTEADPTTVDPTTVDPTTADSHRPPNTSTPNTNGHDGADDHDGSDGHDGHDGGDGGDGQGRGATDPDGTGPCGSGAVVETGDGADTGNDATASTVDSGNDGAASPVPPPRRPSDDRPSDDRPSD